MSSRFCLCMVRAEEEVQKKQSTFRMSSKARHSRIGKTRQLPGGSEAICVMSQQRVNAASQGATVATTTDSKDLVSGGSDLGPAKQPSGVGDICVELGHRAAMLVINRFLRARRAKRQYS